MAFDPDTEIGKGSARFPSTHHSAVQAIRHSDPSRARQAWESIVSAYWKPVYKYIRIRWRKSNDDAKDLTQSFFTTALDRDFVHSFDPAKGTFRTFLRVCVDRFVSHESEAARRLKRGGGALAESLEDVDPPDTLDPEACFHREWVRHLFSLAVSRLRLHCANKGKQVAFEIFELYDLNDEPLSYKQLAHRFDLHPATVTTLLAFARREFRAHVLDILREVTASDREFRAEARAVLGDKAL